MTRSTPTTLALTAASAVALGAAGCGSPEPRVADSVFFGVPYLQDDDGNWFVVDTGSPRSIVDPRIAGLPAGSFADRAVPGWRIAGLATASVPVVVSDLDVVRSRIQQSLEPFGGLIGADLLAAEDSVTFDTERERIAFNDPEAVSGDTGAPAEIPFELLGAGGTCVGDDCFEYDRNRIVVPLTVEGVDTHAIIDTGATFSAMLGSLAARLPERADRPRLDLGGAEVIRVADVALGGQVETNRIVAIPDQDAVFAKLQVETNRPVELILGHSILANHVTEIGYAGGVLRLRPHLDSDDELGNFFVSPGVDLAEDGGCFRVTGVVAGSDAEARGLTAGDCLTAIAGMAAGEVALGEVLGHVRGLAVGTEVAVTGVRGDEAGEQVFEATLAVIDRLPRMQ